MSPGEDQKMKYRDECECGKNLPAGRHDRARRCGGIEQVARKTQTPNAKEQLRRTAMRRYMPRAD